MASVHPGVVDGPIPDGLVLLGRLVRLSRQFPLLMVPAEFATVGPVLNLMIGGRSGADRYRAALRLDTEAYIPLYRATLRELLRPVPGRVLLTDLVERAIRHDLQENANMCAALDELDPSDGAAPRVHAATRYTVPAAAHATVKFAALAPALPPAGATAAMLALRTLQLLSRRLLKVEDWNHA